MKQNAERRSHAAAGYRWWSRTTVFLVKNWFAVAPRATIPYRRRCPQRLDARRAAGAPPHAPRGTGTSLGLLLGRADARGTPPRGSMAPWKPPVGGQTIQGCQLAARGLFWAAGAPSPTRFWDGLLNPAPPCKVGPWGTRAGGYWGKPLGIHVFGKQVQVVQGRFALLSFTCSRSCG